ncbi:MAG: PQQ-binding-like beta-propeller repeat protein [Myxococcales bacterium]|nr:PQQ-binding-like beta-propeller repeat protein [Myxococcales bacterium]
MSFQTLWRHLWVLVVGLALACGDDSGDDGNGDGPADAAAGDGDGDTGAGDGDTGDGDGDASSGNGSTGDGVWAQMGYDEKNWYFNPDETTLSVDNAGSLEQKWSFTIAGFPPGTPVIAEGKVFVMATGGTYAIDFESGEEVWSRTDIAGSASVAYEPGFIYVHDQNAQLWKLKTDDGTEEWGPVQADEQPGCDGTSSPIVGGGKVIVGHSCGLREVGMAGGPEGARGGVEAHDTGDGSKLWTYWTADEDENGAMVWSSVGIDVDSGTVYATTGNNYTAEGPNSDAIHAIDLEDGTRKWMTQVRSNDVWSIPVRIAGPDTDFGANPIIVDGAVAAGDKGSAFWSMDADTGEILWSREGMSAARDQAHGGILMNGAYDGENFYALVNDTSNRSTLLYGMNGDDGEDVFEPKRFDGKFAWGAPAIANGVLVAPVDDDLHILDASSGETLTMFNTGGTIAAGSAAIVDGKVIVQSGLQYPFDPSTKPNNQIICYGLP